MEKYFDWFLLRDADLGFPRFTTLRRRLAEYDELAQDLYRKMCRDFGIEKPLPLSVGMMLNGSQIISDKKPSGGICFPCYYAKAPEVWVEWRIFVSVTHSKLYHERTLWETIPHEVSHAIHGMVDRESFEEHEHGNEFMDIFKICQKFYYRVIPGTAFRMKSTDFYTMLDEAKSDLDRFGAE